LTVQPAISGYCVHILVSNYSIKARTNTGRYKCFSERYDFTTAMVSYTHQDPSTLFANASGSNPEENIFNGIASTHYKLGDIILTNVRLLDLMKGFNYNSFQHHCAQYYYSPPYTTYINSRVLLLHYFYLSLRTQLIFETRQVCVKPEYRSITTPLLLLAFTHSLLLKLYVCKSRVQEYNYSTKPKYYYSPLYTTYINSRVLLLHYFY
jgi:hypothetical protein